MTPVPLDFIESCELKTPRRGDRRGACAGYTRSTQLLGTATRCGTTGWRGPLGLM